jgi:hypothetical protein
MLVCQEVTMGKTTKNKPSSQTLQVRMEPELLDALRIKAERLGFRSLPAYVRAWASAEVHNEASNRHIYLNEASVMVLRYITMLLAAQRPQTFRPDRALLYVEKQLHDHDMAVFRRELGIRRQSF